MSSPDSLNSAYSSSSSTTAGTRPRAMSSGTIKTFDGSQRQGWIRPSDGSKDVHFHLSNMQTNIKTLFPGQKITFAVREDDAKEEDGAGHPIAVDVEADDGHLEPRFLKLGH